MNNKITIILAIVAVVLLGSAWYLFSRSVGGSTGTSLVATTTQQVSTSTSVQKPTPKPASKPPARKPTTTTAKTVGIGPLSFLVGLKQSLNCSVKSANRTGVVYIAGGRIRGNFANSSMISDGTYLYAWMHGASKGLKLLASISVAGGVIAENGGIDPAIDISYACNPWTVDESVFTVPSAISFSNTLQ